VSGKLYVSLKKKPRSTFTVETPTATTGARGTGWVQSIDSVEVFESSVYARNAKGDEVTVAEGTGLPVGDDGTFGAAFTLAQAARDSWNAFLSAAEPHLAAFRDFLGKTEQYEKQTSAEYSGFTGPDMTILLSWQAPVNVDLWIESSNETGRPPTLTCERGPCFEMFRPWDVSGLAEDKKYYVAASLPGMNREEKARVTLSVAIPGRFRRSMSAELDESQEKDFWIAFSVDTAGRVEEINAFDTSFDNYFSTHPEKAAS
jgi:hypothetical protein